MTTSTSFKQIQRLLIGNGALLIFFAGTIGFGFLFFILGEVSLWPIPGRLEVQLPGSIKAWHMAHLEGVINGVILWVMVPLVPLLPFALRWAWRIAVGMIIVAWTFTIASLFGALFPESRGLAYGGPLTNQIAFFLFYVGILIVMGVMGSIAWKTLIATPPND